MRRTLAFLGTLLALLLLASSASAFCGFYVSGSNDDLYNDATRVALMRDGKRTVLSMQNNYEGPPEDFAMVVPVPVVLKKKEVKTLEGNVFARLDRLTAPRLVEYWERDPCYKPPRQILDRSVAQRSAAPKSTDMPQPDSKGKVKVEAKFKVGEYDIVVLSSTESTALEDWLNANDYNIPDGAAPYFKPYIQKGQYFFVAKVNMDKVQYKDGEAVLSPIRFHYDSDDFVLPVRLGLINSKGAQDLIAFILAKNNRYEVANLPNVTIPTNIPVKEETKKDFSGFYSQLFDNVLKENPQAVVTEYAWQFVFNGRKCDPCPPEPPGPPAQFRSLGADVLPSASQGQQQRQPTGRGMRRRRPVQQSSNWVITRLHTRYGKHTLGEDLVFKPAEAIVGGNGMPQGAQGTFANKGVTKASTNRFQGRYIIRHFWEGDIDCENPRRGVWGGPGGNGAPSTGAADDLGFSESGETKPLATFVDDRKDVPGLKMSIDKYDSPAGDVIESWGKLVEAPSMDDLKGESGGGGTTGGNADDGNSGGDDGSGHTGGGASSAGGSDSGSQKTGGCASFWGGGSSAAILLLGLFGMRLARRRIDISVD
ncbi:MAG: DUF2330 domain-containing protein [Myxococcota bacterium]